MSTRTFKRKYASIPTNHKLQHLATAKRLLPRPRRWAMGAALHAIVAELDGYGNNRCRGFPYFNQGGMVNTMWVVKTPVQGLRRGQQVRVRSAMEHYEGLGATFRTVRFPKKEFLRDKLGEAAREVRELHHPRQFGFVPQRNCIQSAHEHRDARVVFNVDFESAFDQVTQHEVEHILREVFLLNRRDSSLLALYCCHSGRLYQGNPMAPVLFNIRALWCVERLHRLCKANDLVLTVYADDVTISSSKWGHFSKGFRRTVYRIIGECGLQVNPRKCKVAQVSPYKIGHYDITGLTVDFDEYDRTPYVRPLHRKRCESKAEYLERVQRMGIKYSREFARDGEPKELGAVIGGLRNWAHQEGRSRPSSGQLLLSSQMLA